MTHHDSDPHENDTLQRTLVGVAAVAATAGAAFFIGSKLLSGRDEPLISDAPEHVRRGAGGPIGRTVTINKPSRELYDFWRDFNNLPRFMDNVRSVELLDGKRSRWTIKAPAGTAVTLVNRIVADEPGRLIAWESEEESDIVNRGRIEFIDAAPGRGTMVRATIEYHPPAGTVGKLAAKLLQREPAVQARRDLRRFKQLMETGEVTSSASPSARKSESPTEQAL